MDAVFKNKWVGGVFFAAVALVWGAASLISGKLTVPIRSSRFLPSFSHIVVQGWPGVCLSLALIFAAVWMHSGFFWSQYTKWQRPASLISLCAAWIAGPLFAVGTIAWAIRALTDW
jgi:hypothetical protein